MPHLDTVVIRRPLRSGPVTMGTRLERTEVTLCGSNTELIHRALLFLKSSTWSLSKVAVGGGGLLLSHHCIVVSTYACLPPHALSSQHTSDVSQFYCRMFTGESSASGSSPPAVSKGSLVIISPSLLFEAAASLPFVLALYPLFYVWLLENTPSSDMFEVFFFSFAPTSRACHSANAINSFVMVHDISVNRSGN